MFEEKEVNLFLMSLTGTTIQYGGTRERRMIKVFVIGNKILVLELME